MPLLHLLIMSLPGRAFLTSSILLLGMSMLPCQAQTPFAHTFGDSLLAEQASGVIQMPNADVFVIGNITNTASKGDQVALSKFSPEGHLLWQETYGDTLNESSQGLAIQTEESLVITGSIFNPQTNDVSAWFIRVDTSGNLLQQWVRTDSGRNSSFKTAAVLPDGSFLACGSISALDAGGNDSYLHYFDGQGQAQWTAPFRDSLTNDIAHAAALGPEGGFLVAGERQMPDFTYRNYVLKLDPSGQTEWAQTLDYGLNAGSQNIIRAQSGDYMLVGEIYPDSQTFFFDYLVVCLDSSGQEKWHQFYGDARADACFSIAEVQSGYFMLGGYGYNTLLQNTDFFLVLIDSLGQASWSTYWGEFDLDMALSLYPANQGGLYAAGFLTTPEDDQQQVLWYDPLELLQTSLELQPETRFRYFPNPLQSDRMLHTAHLQSTGAIELIGLDGTIHWHQNLTRPWTSIQFPKNLASGLYILHFNSPRGTVAEKILLR